MRCKGVFHRYYNQDLTVRKHKYRICVMGCMAKEGRDYDAESIFSPVSDITAFRTMVAYCAGRRGLLKSFDVSGAFLQVQTDPDARPIYVQPPEGWDYAAEGASPNDVWLLTRYAYGLKDSGSQFFKELS